MSRQKSAHHLVSVSTTSSATPCNIRMPDGIISKEDTTSESVPEPDANFRKRQQLITFGHSQWGFKNWNWSVSKQEIDFIDYSNGKFCVGVVAFVSISVTSLGLHREDVGYATTMSLQKGHAIYNARKASITNALRETLLSFGGTIASQLIEQIESNKTDKPIEKRFSLETALDNGNINSQISAEPNNAFVNHSGTKGQPERKDSSDSSVSTENNLKGVRSPQKFGNQSHAKKSNGEKSLNHSSNNHIARVIPTSNQVEMQNFPANQMTAKANHNSKVVNPINPSIPPPSAIVPGNMRSTSGPPPLPSSHHPSKVSYLVQHVMPPLYSVQCGTPHTPPPPMYHNTFFTEFPSWPLYDNFERHHNKVNMNMHPKNFAMNGQTGMMEYQQACEGRSPPMNVPKDPSIGTSASAGGQSAGV
ncbi:uncharacterized protein LOC143915735 isoform X2 [Arctopsyche grandis]|uniref:uncharacterized protein LOC143915735 isoform X2 n=1 Tax=Arctopsyche grandis TaxID=121162 RepID=UPI00406D791A